MDKNQKSNNKSCQHAVTVALNHEEIGKHTETITNVTPFINKYKWEGINFPSEKDDWEKTEKNNVAIVLSILHA